MKLSVIVPAFKLEQYILPCLLSVLEQEVSFDYEVIVCDDASPDSTVDKIASIAARFDHLRPIYKPKNQGLAANIATLLEAARGEYIAYLDGDDLALPGKLQRQVDYLDNHGDCAMVYHESDMFDSDTDKSIRLYSQTSYNWDYIPVKSELSHLVRYGTYMQASSVMFRNHDKLAASVPDMCKIILDYPFYMLNAGYLRGTIDYLPDVLGRYRVHQDSFGAQTSRSAERREQNLVDLENACLATRQFGLDEEIIQQGIAHHRFAAALYFLLRQDYARFQKFIVSSTSGETFFNDKHQKVWQYRADPEKALSVMESMS